MALCGFLFCLASYLWILRHSRGEWSEDKKEGTDPNKISMVYRLISSGSIAFLKKEYSILVFILAMATLAINFYLDLQSSIAYLTGALASMFCGFIGIKAATKANARTVWAAHLGDKEKAFTISFHAATVMGIAVASLGILGIFIAYAYLVTTTLEPLVGFAVGASSTALFSRVGGGIYTKAADVGADLASKLEGHFESATPECNNPATIVDNVGDNVGDTAGMGADLFESYCGSIIATMIIGSTLPSGQSAAILLPLIAATIGLLASIATISSMNILKKFGLGLALRVAPFIALGLLFAGSYYAISAMDFDNAFENQLGPYFAMITGSFIGLFIGISSEYYTSPDGPAVKRISFAGKNGAATHLLMAMAMGMYSCIIPVLLICFGVYLAHSFAELYGIGMAAVGMISTVGMNLSLDAQRPIVDNARGIAKICSLSPKTQQSTTELARSVGKTASIGKGFAVGTAAFTALALFSAFATASGLGNMSLVDPKVVIGILLGGVLPFFVAANTINAVGNAAQKIVHEVKKQFNQFSKLTKEELPQELKNNSTSDRCIKIATIASLRQMIKPGMVAITLPIMVGHLLGKEALAGLLAGVTVSGVILAMFLVNVGGALDSSKKAIEAGNILGEQRGSTAHDSATIGNTIGDPLRDAAGPALNILVKLVAIIALVMAPLIS